MCELLGLSSNVPTTLSLSLRKLAEHGGPPASIADGWGVAYYEGRDVRLIKDCASSEDSDWVRFVANHDLRSRIVVSHIRKATTGDRAYRNTQPFTRELSGSVHLFAHNGWLHGISGNKDLQSRSYCPVGETDSEQAFCGLLERMRSVWTVPGIVPPLQARMAALASIAAELRVLGPANFLYSDGDTLFAHADRRKNASTGKVGPPGLVLLRRYCSPNSRNGMASGLSIKSQDHFVTLVASVPLSDDVWEPLGEGEIVAIKDGESVRFPLGGL